MLTLSVEKPYEHVVKVPTKPEPARRLRKKVIFPSEMLLHGFEQGEKKTGQQGRGSEGTTKE